MVRITPGPAAKAAAPPTPRSSRARRWRGEAKPPEAAPGV